MSNDEKRVTDEGKRLVQMYSSESEAHKLGNNILRFMRQRTETIRLMQHFTWQIERVAPELMNGDPYKRAKRLIKTVGAQISECNRGDASRAPTRGIERGHYPLRG